MAEAFLNNYFGNQYEAKSAGTQPTSINPFVVHVMAEEGIDLTHARSKSMEEYLEMDFNLVVTVCDGVKEACPVFPGDELIHHGFEDPSSLEGNETQVLEKTRIIRDEIKKWILDYFGPTTL